MDILFKELGQLFIDLALQLSLNDMRVKRESECKAERRRLEYRRLPGEFQIRAVGRHCKILQLF